MLSLLIDLPSLDYGIVARVGSCRVVRDLKISKHVLDGISQNLDQTLA